MLRQPVVAGQFYEEDEKALLKQIEDCFLSRFGPQSLPEKRDKNKEVFSAIVPHAGYMASGPCAAWVYKEIGESKFPDCYVILGTHHTGLGRTSVMTDDWKTPLGIVKTDKVFAEALLESSDISNERLAHENEHSIEVQLPFLQFVSKDNINDLRIVPIIVSHDISCDEIAESIKKTAELTKTKICVIASSDFTHYGYSYAYVPFSHSIKENLYKLDGKAIEYIKKLDISGFSNYLSETGATICGSAPITTMMHYSRLIGAKNARLLKYYCSGDVFKDYNTSVGYAGIVVDKIS